MSEMSEAVILSPLMSSPEGSPARTSAVPARKSAPVENAAASGRSMREWFAIFDRGTLSWKTSQCSLLEPGGWGAFSGIWPRSGMTRTGKAYRLRSLGRHISALGSSWLATPTETANQTCPAMMKWPGCRRWLPTPNTHGVNNDGRWSELGGQGNPFRGTPMASVRIQPWQYEWMMGFPIGWTDLGDSATLSSHRSQSSSDAA